MQTGFSSRLLSLSLRLYVIYCSDKADYLRDKLSGSGIAVLSGTDGLCEAACMDGTDILINSVVGMVGLQPTLAAIDAGIDIALANKETLVTGGCIVTEAAKSKGVKHISGRQRALSHFPVPSGKPKTGSSQNHTDRFGRSVFRKKKSELSEMTAADALSTRHGTWAQR